MKTAKSELREDLGERDIHVHAVPPTNILWCNHDVMLRVYLPMIGGQSVQEYFAKNYPGKEQHNTYTADNLFF